MRYLANIHYPRVYVKAVAHKQRTDVNNPVLNTAHKAHKQTNKQKTKRLFLLPTTKAHTMCLRCENQYIYRVTDEGDDVGIATFVSLHVIASSSKPSFECALAM